MVSHGLFLTQWIMPILSKICKPDNFELHNSLKLSFTNIWGLLWILLRIFPWIKLSWYSSPMWDKFGWLNWFWVILSSFNLKLFYYIHGLALFVKDKRLFALDLSLETLHILTYVFDLLYSTQCLNMFSFYRSPSPSLCITFYLFCFI